MTSVITIGTATRDVFLTSKLFKILKDKKHLNEIGFSAGEATCFALGSKVEIEKPVFQSGGGAVNAAITFSRMGVRTSSFVKIGNDPSGKEILSDLRREKVQPIAVKDNNNLTGYSAVLIEPTGERTILVYRGASGGLKRKDFSFSRLRGGWVYIAPGAIDYPLMLEIIDHFKKKKAFVAMNPSAHYIKMGKNKIEPMLKKLDVVILNREEASELTGVQFSKTRGIFKKFDGVVPGIAVMTDGAKGSYVSDGRYLYTAGIFKEKKLIDRSGAGDAFGSGFVAGLIMKNDIHFALKVAAANATSVVEQVGANKGVLRKTDLNKPRFKYLDLGVEPL